MKSEKMEVESHLDNYVKSMQNRLTKTDFDEVIRLLSRIFENIRDNVT